MSVAQRGRVHDLDARLVDLAAALRLAEGRLQPEAVDQGWRVVRRAGQRLGLGVAHTVVALAGATGSGKSSLFNALAGDELSPPGVRRPTTGHAHACIWGADDASSLLSWLQVPIRHHAQQDPLLDGLVLLDLPDHDSVEVAHRLEVDRLVELVDLLVWVLDPQKYADADVHDNYFTPLAHHEDAILVVLNQVDRLGVSEVTPCLRDLRQLLNADGIGHVPVLATSATTGQGLIELRAELAARVASRRAAVERLLGGVDEVVAQLSESCGSRRRRRAWSGQEHSQLLAALSEAGGAETVVEAVAGAHRHRAIKATGWPFTRWLRRLRPDPLARLHLNTGDPESRSSLALPTPLARAHVSTAIRSTADALAGDLPSPWPTLVRRAAVAEEERLPALLERAVAGSQIVTGLQPRWWRLAGAVQAVLAAVALVGGIWLCALFLLAWLKLPDPPLPRAGRVPLPTVLLGVGVVGGLLAAALGRQLARVGGRRRARAARARIEQAVSVVADEHVLGPMWAELEVRDALCDALARAAR